MSLHLLVHPWQVHEIDDGTLVKLGHLDLDAATLSIFVEELLELAQESGQPNLYIDFTKLSALNSLFLGKLVALDRELSNVGCRLVLLNLTSAHREILQVVGWPSLS